MYINSEGKKVLTGSGVYDIKPTPGSTRKPYKFEVIVDGEDLVVRDARATWFGGKDDPLDSGSTASGINTKDNPDIMGCALPLNYGPCVGSPLPKMPYKTTKVKVYNKSNGKIIVIPLIDLGPSPPPHAYAQIDLTQAAFKALGGNLKTGELSVSYRVLGGAKYIPKK